MSSTNRGYDRHKSDYYVTPLKPIKDFLGQFLLDVEIDRPDKLMWLDPCAGGMLIDGEVVSKMSYPSVIENEFGVAVSTWDIRKDSLAEFKDDYITHSVQSDEYDIIITNPPFYCAIDIINKALKDVKEGGYVIMLLRLNFLGSKERKPFFEKFMPKYIYTHSKRISFIKGTTDSVEYGHFVWQKGFNPEWSLLKII